MARQHKLRLGKVQNQQSMANCIRDGLCGHRPVHDFKIKNEQEQNNLPFALLKSTVVETIERAEQTSDAGQAQNPPKPGITVNSSAWISIIISRPNKKRGAPNFGRDPRLPTRLERRGSKQHRQVLKPDGTNNFANTNKGKTKEHKCKIERYARTAKPGLWTT